MNAVFRSVQVTDLALLSEADVAVKEIERCEKEEELKGNGKARIDLLFLIASPVSFQPRNGWYFLYFRNIAFLHCLPRQVYP